MQTLLAAIRAACSPQAWSRGVELSRSGAVVGEREGEDEIVLRVTPRRGSPGVSVTLFPAEDEWSCECSSREDACAHAAAAVIATHRARLDGLGLPRLKGSVARLGYRFTRTADGLAIERVIIEDKQETPLLGTLAERNRGENGRELRVSPGDQAAEAALGGRNRGLLSRVILHRVLAALRDCDDVQLDGRPVTVGAPQPVMRARVERRAAGLYLSLVQDPAVHEVFGNGAVRCGNTLRPIGDLPMSQGEVAELRRGRLFGAAEMPELLSEIVPELRRRIPVDLKGAALPQTVQVPPRVEITVEPVEDGMSLLPVLVYGEPALARVDRGRLRHLRGAMPVRDHAAEAKLTERLQRELALSPGERQVVVGSEAVAMATRLRDWEAEVRGDAHRSFFVAAPLSPQVQIGASSLEVTFEGLAAEAGAPPPTVSATAVLRAWQRSEPMVPLLAGGWAPVPQEWLDRHGAQLVSLLAARDAKAQLPAHALPQLAALSDALEHPKPPALAQLQARLADFTKIPAARLPADLTAELRDYQRQGVDWLCFLRGCGMGAMLADDMGLGKTLQTLCAVRGRTLVVAPTSVLQNWAAEAERFRPRLKVQIYHGPNRALDPGADLTLTTYALMRLDQAALGAVTWDTLVLDEAQAIKNPDSQVARAAFGLAAKFRITLTGTPVENRLEELWSQFHFINPGLLGGRQDFVDTFARPVAAGEPGVAKRLRDRIAPFVLRRLKVDVARELPMRTDGVLRCTLTEEERAVYDAILASTRRDVLAKLEAGGSVMQALEALLRLRQACCHAALIPGQKAASSAKLDLLCETLDSIFSEGHRALVFSQWTGLLDLLEPALAARKIAFTRLDGTTRDRGAVVRAFQEASGPPLMLVSLKAGGTGLNLTAADHVFLLDPWWNPAVEDQAADRAHRIGQTRPVFVHRLVAEDTVEERILALQDEKRAVAVAALEGADRGASLTRDDLMALLR